MQGNSCAEEDCDITVDNSKKTILQESKKCINVRNY